MKKADIAARLLSAASRHPPREKVDLVEAMNAELHELEQGRFAWSLGGIFAIARWRVSEDWVFLGAVTILAPCAGLLTFLPLMFLPPHLLVDHPDIARSWFLASLLLGCCLLAVIRPFYWRLVGIGVPVASSLQGYLTVQAMVQRNGGHLGHYVIMDAPPVVGLAALIAAGVLGAWIGQLINSNSRLAQPS